MFPQRILAMTRSVLILQGSLAILFGAVAMLWPGMTTLVLAYLFAVFLLVDGAVLLLLGLAARIQRARTRTWWGVAQILLGLYVLYNPDLTVGVLIMVLGLTLLVRGLFNISHALLWVHEPLAERTVHGAMGIIGLVIGTVVALQPVAGGLAFVWVLGLYAVATGSALVALGAGVGEKAARRHRHAAR
jgi:uncharacterized membrane protein HdeD (DUF308 family)